MILLELFESEVLRLWLRLSKDDRTIFEGIDPLQSIDVSTTRWKIFKEDSLYMDAVNGSTYERKRIIEEHFWDTIVGELYEDTVAVMHSCDTLEEAGENYKWNYKLETTARLILENGVFRTFTDKKEITDTIINDFFYPSEARSLEEGFSIRDSFSKAVQGIIQAAKIIKGMWLLIAFLFITPATVLIGGVGTNVIRATNAKKDGARAAMTTGALHPTIKNIFKNVDIFGAGGAVMGAGLMFSGAVGVGATLAAGSVIGGFWAFLNKDLIELSEYLHKINTLDNDYLQEVISGVGADSDKIIIKCWNKNRHQPLSPETDQLIGTFLKWTQNSASGLNNLLRFPPLRNAPQIALLLKEDASNPAYQKMFFDFRICMYDKIFDIIIGYAEAIYSVDDSSYDIITAANRMHQKKNFKEFFKMDPKTDNDIAMFKLIKALISMDDMVFKLKVNKSELIGDINIERFITHMEQKIKQTYSTLDEMANQSKNNFERFGSREPDDEEEQKINKEIRDDKKRSIFRDPDPEPDTKG